MAEPPKFSSQGCCGILVENHCNRLLLFDAFFYFKHPFSMLLHLMLPVTTRVKMYQVIKYYFQISKGSQNDTVCLRDRDAHKQWNWTPFLLPFLLLCPNHLLLEFTKNLTPKPFASAGNTLASVRFHTHADKLDCFTHK